MCIYAFVCVERDGDRDRAKNGEGRKKTQKKSSSNVAEIPAVPVAY
jgi:hypothetical protein